MEIRLRKYSEKEELANAISHAFGILLGIVAALILLPKAYDSGNMWAVISVFFYLFGMLFSYVTSTWYHSCKVGKKKGMLQKLDHAAIYCHIAGSYTPFCLVTMRQEGAWGWSLFAFVWGAAIIGTIASFRKSGKHNYLETVCYVLMGCAIFVAFKPLINALEAVDRIDALSWLIGGGVSYIVGAIFYSLAKVKYMHTIFHFFVLGGSICHIIAIYRVI